LVGTVGSRLRFARGVGVVGELRRRAQCGAGQRRKARQHHAPLVALRVFGVMPFKSERGGSFDSQI